MFRKRIYFDGEWRRICLRVVPMGWLSGYAAIGVGFAITIAVQSSSITTSALTPLVGVGVIKLERMYPTVLGANIGTTSGSMARNA